MHHGMSRPPSSSRHHAGAAEAFGLADVLEPDADQVVPSSRLLPAQVQDFAFADTVYSNDLLDDAAPCSLPPPSGPIFAQDSLGNTQCMTPLAFPLPPAAANIDVRTRLRVFFAHARHAVRGSHEEMTELWAGTDQLVSRRARGAGRLFRRLLALWSLFQWSRSDVTRAALIGLAVFVVAGALGSVVIDLGDSAAASASSDEVRARHTLDQQHTGKRLVARSKR